MDLTFIEVMRWETSTSPAPINICRSTVCGPV